MCSIAAVLQLLFHCAAFPLKHTSGLRREECGVDSRSSGAEASLKSANPYTPEMFCIQPVLSLLNYLGLYIQALLVFFPGVEGKCDRIGQGSFRIISGLI